MPLIQIPVGVTPTQVDDFPAKVKDGEKERSFERSCKGSLHIRPASTKIMTDDELKHMRTARQHKAWGRRLIEVKVEVAKAPEKKLEATPFVSPPKSEDLKPDAEESPKRGRRGRSG